MKTILITGGNAGIGKATAIGLAKQGAQVVIVSRNAGKGQAALAEIRVKSQNEHCGLLVADLSKLSDVRELAAQFLKEYGKIDVLINNAGVIVSKLGLTEEGYELQFGVNHLAHFLLTQLLLDALKASPAGRVVTVASGAHYKGEMDFDNLRGENPKYNGLAAYGRSKLANVLFTRELSRRLEGSKVIANCLHPGVVRTQIGNKSNWLYSLAWTMIKPFMITTEQGAKTSIFLASSPDVDGISGKYFEKMKERKPSRAARNDKLAKRLWEYSVGAVDLDSAQPTDGSRSV